MSTTHVTPHMSLHSQSRTTQTATCLNGGLLWIDPGWPKSVLCALTHCNPGCQNAQIERRLLGLLAAQISAVSCQLAVPDIGASRRRFTEALIHDACSVAAAEYVLHSNAAPAQVMTNFTQVQFLNQQTKIQRRFVKFQISPTCFLSRHFLSRWVSMPLMT